MLNLHNYPSRHQSGVVLITSLVFMVVLTMIVLSVLRSGTLEERIASNLRNRQTALQAAEAVARDAESLITSAPFSPYLFSSFTAGCTNGLCTIPAAGSTPRWQTIDWSDTALTRSFAAVASHLNGVSSQPRYIVELIRAPSKAGSTMNICEPGMVSVTARGVGMDASVVFIQTTLRFMPVDC